VRTGGDRRNRDFAGPHVESSAPDALETLSYDPQTAGGLLVSLPAEQEVVVEATFRAQGLFITRIGHVETGAGVVLRS
jgi:selenide,water dikinase